MGGGFATKNANAYVWHVVYLYPSLSTTCHQSPLPSHIRLSWKPIHGVSSSDQVPESPQANPAVHHASNCRQCIGCCIVLQAHGHDRSAPWSSPRTAESGFAHGAIDASQRHPMCSVDAGASPGALGSADDPVGGSGGEPQF